MDKVNITAIKYKSFIEEHALYLACNIEYLGFYFIDNRFGKILLNIHTAAKSIKQSTLNKYG